MLHELFMVYILLEYQQLLNFTKLDITVSAHFQDVMFGNTVEANLY